MCGIIGCTGNVPTVSLILDTLEKLQYRGYDSSGLALASPEKMWLKKTTGNATRLRSLVPDSPLPDCKAGIGHTRWATHGKVNDANAHPFVSNDGKFAVVHNGIIENCTELKTFLQNNGYVFSSETDSETVPLLLQHFYNGDVIRTIFRTLSVLKGSYALAIVTTYAPEKIFAVRQNSSLAVARSRDASFVCSDVTALSGRADNCFEPDDNCVACLAPDGITLLDAHGKPTTPKKTITIPQTDLSDKGGYPHFMLKEIHSQPQCLAAAAAPFFDGTELKTDLFTADQAKKIRRVVVTGCGSAYHAGVAGKNYIEKIAGIPAEAELASEFRNRISLLDESVLTVFVSQSGETADTLFALRQAQKAGVQTLAIVNTPESSISREAAKCIFTNAGPEIAVATTKGYTTQVLCLYLLANVLAKLRDKHMQAPPHLAKTVFNLPTAVRKVLSEEHILHREAERLSPAQSVFFIGRNMDYAAAQEGALKLKEITYQNANAYAAGELKHGTISLIEKGTPVLTLATDEETFPKTASNVAEVAARGAEVLLFTSDRTKDMSAKLTGHIFCVPDCDDLTLIPLSTALQLLAYHTAVLLNRNVDQPRNLAKSVTVE